jgi:hypothetical protein
VRKTRPFAERFWSKVDKRGPDECWPWLASVNASGYGRLTAGRGVNLKAHRVSYTLEKGPIPDGMNVLHHCDNPPCCNPGHLFAGTHKDNTQDMLSKDRGVAPPHSFGKEHHHTKFDDAAARRIIADQRTHHVIAAEYGVCSMTVFRLKHGQTWKKLDRQGAAQ